MINPAYAVGAVLLVGVIMLFIGKAWGGKKTPSGMTVDERIELERVTGMMQQLHSSEALKIMRRSVTEEGLTYAIRLSEKHEAMFRYNAETGHYALVSEFTIGEQVEELTKRHRMPNGVASDLLDLIRLDFDALLSDAKNFHEAALVQKRHEEELAQIEAARVAAEEAHAAAAAQRAANEKPVSAVI